MPSLDSEGLKPLREDVLPAQPTIRFASLFGFSVGMIGDRIFRDAPALLLLIFMTDYLGVPPALAGTAVFIPKLLILFVDPLVGNLSDRLQTRWAAAALRAPPPAMGGRTSVDRSAAQSSWSTGMAVMLGTSGGTNCAAPL